MKAPLLNPVLSGIASRFLADLPTVGTRIAPVVNTQLHSAAYYVFDNSVFTDVPTNIQRGPSSGFKRIISKLSDDTYLAKDYGVEEVLDKMEVAMYSDAFAADRAAMERAVRVVALNHEIRVRALAITATSTSSPTVKWGASTATTIISDIETAKGAILAKVGVLPNLLTIPYAVYAKLIVSPELLSYLRVTDGVLTKAALESIFGLEIVISKDVMNTAAEGQTPSLGGIWSNEAFLSYSNSTTDLRALNFARTFNWTANGGSGPKGIATYTYDEDNIDSRVVRARQYTDEKIIANGAGYYFSSVLS